MEIESEDQPKDEEEEEEKKDFVNYNGNYDENLDKYLKIFLKKAEFTQKPHEKPPKNKKFEPFPLKSHYLAKRKFEYYFIQRKNFKKIRIIQ